MCCCCLQNKLTHAPHAALKAQPCPREGCTGRVQDTDRVMQTKRKKTLEASLAAPAAIPVPAPKPSGKGRRTHKAPRDAEVTLSCLSPHDLLNLLHKPCSKCLQQSSYALGCPRLVCLPSMRLCMLIAWQSHTLVAPNPSIECASIPSSTPISSKAY